MKITAPDHCQSQVRILLFSFAVTVLSACGGGSGGGGGGVPPVPVPHTWVATNRMLTARSGHTATLLPNGRVLIAGGSDTNSSVVASAELYDPSTGTWAYTGTMNAKRTGHTATLLPNGTVLIAGGNGSCNTCVPLLLASAELYDPTTGTWTLTGNMNSTRYSHVAVLLRNGKVLAAGNANGFSLGPAELYDPSAGTWALTQNAGTEPINGSNLATLLPSGMALAIGYPPQLFDPSASIWTSTGAIPGAGTYYGPFFTSLTLLQNGTALIAGGFYWAGGVNGAFPPVSGAYIYQPSTGAWTATGNMTEARAYPTATLLSDGKVLAFGEGSSDTDNSSELYDPTTGTWNLTGSMNTPRYFTYATATLLQSGAVLVAGGSTGSPNSAPIAEAEIYFP
jgi:Galactose oxidase, central domain